MQSLRPKKKSYVQPDLENVQACCLRNKNVRIISEKLYKSENIRAMQFDQVTQL